MSPAFGIGQRALLVCTPDGNVLWDCIALIDDAAQQRIHDLGGIDVIAMSQCVATVPSTTPSLRSPRSSLSGAADYDESGA